MPTKSRYTELKPKIEAAFSTGCTIREAALFAEITEQYLYYFFRKYPDWKTHCMLLRHKPTLKARANVVKDLHKENVDTSKWYLERKLKKEFSLRSELTGEDGANIVINVGKYGEADDVEKPEQTEFEEE